MGIVKPRIVCKDGFSISIQASEYHFCAPRVTGLPFYDRYELMCEYDRILGSFNDCGVYSYVPAIIVAKLIEKHGGIAE